MNFLKSLLGKKTLEEFLQNHFTKYPYSAPQSNIANEHLLNWKVVEDIFNANKSVLRIVREGQYFKDEAHENFAQAKALFEQGFTLLIRYAEKSSPVLDNIAQQFKNFFKSEVDVQLYCTPHGHNAFGWHYDVEEVFIIQTKGSKEYTIRPNTIHPNPLVKSIPKDLSYEKESSTLVLKVMLKAGDFLYIPSGWWHKAETQEESMHISIGVMPSSAVKISEFLPAFLAQSPWWRTRMPLHQDFTTIEEAVDFYEEAFKKFGADLAAKMGSREFIREFLEKNK